MEDAFASMKHVRHQSKREEKAEQEKEIKSALEEIRQKHFANAMMKKEPNM